MVADEKDKPIRLVFEDIYNFIEGALVPDGFDIDKVDKTGLLDPKMPISRQNVDVDFCKQTSSASAEEQESKFVEIEVFQGDQREHA